MEGEDGMIYERLLAVHDMYVKEFQGCKVGTPEWDRNLNILIGMELACKALGITGVISILEYKMEG